MAKYTVYSQPWVDKQIQKHLNLAIEIIKRKIKGIVSIILVGGFGRGEGSVKLIDQKMIPLNDYDFYVILKNGLKVSELAAQRLMSEIEKEAGTSGFSSYEKSAKSFYFDIRFLNLKKIAKLPPFIKYYEMKHASYVLSGQDIRDLIPDYKAQDLPISEGLRFMLNRLASISLWGPMDLILKKELAEWHRDTLLYDISKAYLEIGTCLSQLTGVYQPTYQGRLRELKKVLKNPALLNRIAYYTELKLKPDYKQIHDYINRWFSARDDLLIAIDFVLKRAFSIDSFEQFLPGLTKKYFKPYLRIILKNRLGIKKNKVFLPLFNCLAQFYLSIVWFFRVAKFKKKPYWPILLHWRDPGIKIYNASILIVSSINRKGEINLEKLKSGIKLLKKTYPVEIEGRIGLDNFQQIMDAYINAWKLYFFQNIA